ADSVVIDSRKAGPGSLFAALPGEHVDGHDYAAAAIGAGAPAVLASRPVGVPALITPDVPGALAALPRAAAAALPGLTIAGIPGPGGKPPPRALAPQLVERRAPTVAPQGSYNNEIGPPLTVLQAPADTRYRVLELSARKAGDIAWLCRIAPPR